MAQEGIADAAAGRGIVLESPRAHRVGAPTGHPTDVNPQQIAHGTGPQAMTQFLEGWLEPELVTHRRDAVGQLRVVQRDCVVQVRTEGFLAKYVAFPCQGRQNDRALRRRWRYDIDDIDIVSCNQVPPVAVGNMIAAQFRRDAGTGIGNRHNIDVRHAAPRRQMHTTSEARANDTNLQHGPSSIRREAKRRCGR
jgi:hypothetical protein